MNARFTHLRLQGWRQFADIDLDLTAASTVLTGANGCGKTTILNVLSSHFGWNLNFIAAPLIGKRTKQRIFSDRRQRREMEEPDAGAFEIGSIRYDNGQECQLMVPSSNNQHPQYQLQYNRRQNLVGIHIPSHRPSMTFQRVDTLPTDPKTNQQQYQEFQSLLQQMYGSANIRNPGLVLKQSLISLALFGEGNSAVVGNEEYRQLFQGFQDVLRKLLPRSLGFQRLEIRMPDVVLVTDTGSFALDAMSGGVNSLFGIAWQIFMYGADKGGCTVIIDEPENHLHPSMQRTLLPSLERAFPEYRFVVATHSPFIVTSNPSAKVYSLSYDDSRSIRSSLVETTDYGGSADQVLREVLEVPSTIPVWAEERIRKVLTDFQDEPETPAKIQRMLSALREAGLADALLGYGEEE